jgi:hypothetical protein
MPYILVRDNLVMCRGRAGAEWLPRARVRDCAYAQAMQFPTPESAREAARMQGATPHKLVRRSPTA